MCLFKFRAIVFLLGIVLIHGCNSRQKDNTDDALNATEVSATTQFDISNIQLTGNACCFSYGIGSK